MKFIDHDLNGDLGRHPKQAIVASSTLSTVGLMDLLFAQILVGRNRPVGMTMFWGSGFYGSLVKERKSSRTD
jgi:hypothetical protein